MASTIKASKSACLTWKPRTMQGREVPCSKTTLRNTARENELQLSICQFLEVLGGHWEFQGSVRLGVQKEEESVIGIVCLCCR